MSDAKSLPENSSSQTTSVQQTSQHVAVVGAGICGLTTALALSRQGHTVTVLERDVPPPEGGAHTAFFDWSRRGASQFRHPHAFLGLMCNLLADNYPDLLDAFIAAGARRFPFAEGLPEAIRKNYEPEPGDDRLWMLLCRRATIETVLRRYVMQSPKVTILNRQRVTGLLTDLPDGQPVAEGQTITVKGLLRDKDTPFEADLVVDASGRASKFPRWFAQLGAPVREENDDAEIVYYTRHYKLNSGQSEPPRDPDKPGAGDLGFLKYGVFPGDHGHFAFILCLPTAETELKEAIRDGDTFDAICKSVPGLEAWIGNDRATATTPSFGIGGIHAVWRHYVEDDQPLATNFFACGDSAIRTNPLYGRGCSTGTLHAHILADVLNETQDPLERARRFAARSEQDLRGIFKASLAEDRRGIARAQAEMSGQAIDKPKSLKDWFTMAFGDALTAAARDELHVMRGLNRTINLLEEPGAFLKEPAIKRTIFRYMLRGRKRNSAARRQPGLNREEAYALAQSR